MRRSEVKRSYHNSTRGLPMVNVKAHDSQVWHLEKYAAANPDAYENDPLFPAWLEEHEQDLWSDAFHSACEQGWERLEEDAKEIFGRHVKVWGAGRSGGWACVQGLGDVDLWTAPELGKWARFCKYARQNVEGLAWDAVAYLYLNPFQRYRDTVDDCVAMAARDAGVTA